MPTQTASLILRGSRSGIAQDAEALAQVTAARLRAYLRPYLKVEEGEQSRSGAFDRQILGERAGQIADDFRLGAEIRMIRLNRNLIS
jgi:hypothetical protein